MAVQRSAVPSGTEVHSVNMYVWHDLSPDDGCILVRFTMRATS